MGYYDDADEILLSKPWYFPPDQQQFAGRQATYDLTTFVPWWDSNTLNWRLLIYARDRAWQLNQGLLANYQGVAGDWFRNNKDRPGLAGPFPEPPAAYIALTKWMDTAELDGNGNPIRVFEVFDVVQGSQPVCPVPAH